MRLIQPLLWMSAILALMTGCGVGTRATGLPPKPVYPIPSAAQMAWQRMETYAFVHFGLNTYNDLEWGYGNTPMETFAPDTLDVEQWVRTFKSAGLKGVILTAKHHDGFCLWPTKTTEYSVKNSPWQGGRGDLVKDLSEACRKYGLKLGLYLSPWDRNHPEYGRAGYQEVFHEQIRELASGYGELFEYWFDGANGGTGWYGGANETRSINPEEYYRYEEAVKILRANNPDIMIFGGTAPTIRWIGNEQGWAGETNYSPYSFAKERHHKEAQWGMRDGEHWLPGEVDVSIRPGWFYHQREDHQVRSVANLVNLYYQSVGRNANLLLNFPIALDGRIPKTDSLNAVRWHEHVQKTFERDLLLGREVHTTGSREASGSRDAKAFAPSALTDGSSETYWVSSQPQTSLEVHFPRQRINVIALQEYIPLGQRVEAFRLETRDSLGAWHPIETTDSLTTIGYKRLIRLKAPADTDGLRLSIERARGDAVCLARLSAYLAPDLVEAPRVLRQEDGRVAIISPASGNRLRYRLAGGQWEDYTSAIESSEHHLEIEAMAVGSSGTTATTRVRLGYAPSIIQLTTPQGMSPQEAEQASSRLLDSNGFTAVSLPKGQMEVVLSLDEPRPISALEYIPDQRRDATGHIQEYELYIDNRLVAEGEFSNIKHNPIPMRIELSSPLLGQSIRLVARKTVDNLQHLSIGSISLH